jgi:polysaccharide deacetylase family protein (PEP-CTERM system associated)
MLSFGHGAQTAANAVIAPGHPEGFSLTPLTAIELAPPLAPPLSAALQAVVSFDVEEHHRIEAAAGLTVPPDRQAYYSGRLAPSTHWVLEQLARSGVRATFFVLGTIARDHPGLVRAIHAAGHEVASHGWDHRRLHHLEPASFREEVRRSKDTLEQITGEAVAGFRAPTFSIVRPTAWGLDVLAELGLLYDSSIYPVWHDRYGIPEAPRWPFFARCPGGRVLEIPPVTWRCLGMNVPLGGGGYFRLLPLFMTDWALRQVGRQGQPPVAMLYFHPWEFDPEQERLPLRRLSRFRTYVGIHRSRGRLEALLERYRFARAVDVARHLHTAAEELPVFDLTAATTTAT